MSGRPDRIHLSGEDVQKALAEISGAAPPTADRDPYTSLAWRPAWAIRSRRGAWAPFVEMIKEFLRRH